MTNLLDVIELLGLAPPERMPGHILCVGHDEDTPSLWVTEDHWYAFCCAVGGDGIDLVRFATGASFTQAKRFIESGLDTEYVRPEHVERPVLDLTGRFFSETSSPTRDAVKLADEYVESKWPHLTLEWLALAFDVRITEHALWIPHTDDEGVVRGIKTRSLYTGDKKSVDGSTFTTRLYRGLGLAGDTGKAVLCEGESDTWTMTKHYENDIYVSVYGLPAGAKCWKETFAKELLDKHRHVDLWLDQDRTGRQAAAHILEDLQQRGMTVEDNALPIDYGDVTEAYVKGWRP